MRQKGNQSVQRQTFRTWRGPRIQSQEESEACWPLRPLRGGRIGGGVLSIHLTLTSLVLSTVDNMSCCRQLMKCQRYVGSSHRGLQR